MDIFFFIGLILFSLHFYVLLMLQGAGREYYLYNLDSLYDHKRPHLEVTKKMVHLEGQNYIVFNIHVF